MTIGGVEYDAKEWSLSDDILQMSDPFSCTIANVDLVSGREGVLAQKIPMGATLSVVEADPDVDGSGQVPCWTGRVTGVETRSDKSEGSLLLIRGNDLGWHLASTCGEPFFNLKGITFQRLLEAVIDPAWGIKAVLNSNDANRKLKLGRQGAAQAVALPIGTILPRIQIEPGEIIGEVLSHLAKRERWLVGMSADGNLLFFVPKYTTSPTYYAEYHATTEAQRNRNNVIGQPKLTQSIEGVYTEVRCYSTVVIPPAITEGKLNPNEAYRHGTFVAPAGTLPFPRLHVFSDAEAITPEMRVNRATWKWQRGMFDSWAYELEFPSHSQGGHFFASDTMISVNDTVNGVSGNYYVSAVKRSRTLTGGTTAKLTIHKPNLLGA